jgi:hypothetical protein
MDARIQLWVGFGTVGHPGVKLEDDIPQEVERDGEVEKYGLTFEKIFDPETKDVVGFGVDMREDESQIILYGTLLELETLTKVIAELQPKVQAAFNEWGLNALALPHILGSS